MNVIKNQTSLTIQHCLDLMYEGNFDRAEEDLGKCPAENETDRAYLLFTTACICVIKALMSQAANDTERAFEKLHHCQKNAQNVLTTLTFALYPQLQVEDHGMIRLTVGAIKDDLERPHLQLIEAECTLLAAVLESLMMADYGNILHMPSERQRRLLEAYFVLFHAQSGLQQGDRFDHEYVCGVAFTWGLVNLVFHLLPKQFSGRFGVEKVDVEAVMALIDRTLDAGTVHGRFARLLMIFFHLNVSRDPLQVSRLMQPSVLGKESSGPLNVYLSARLLHLQGKTRDCLDLLTASSVSPTRMIVGIHLPCYSEAIKCLAEEQRWHEAVQLTRKLRPFPSAISSLYLEAVMIQASTGRIGNTGALNPQVQTLFGEILRFATAGTAKLTHFDKLALRRASDCVQGEALFFAPQYELLLLWDRLTIKDGPSVAQEISSVMQKYARKLTPDQTILGWLLLALFTADTEHLIVNHILPRDYLPLAGEFYSLRAKLELVKLRHDPLLLGQIEKQVYQRKSSIGQANLLMKIAQLKLTLK